MDNFMNKLLLILLSYFVMNKYMNSKMLVISIFLILILSALNSYMEERREICIIIQAVFAVCCILLPFLLCAAPAVFYDMLRNKNYICEGILTVMLVYAASTSISAAAFCYIILLFLTAGLLLYRSELARVNEARLKSIRDDSVEQENLLRDQNVRLLEHQDQEVYMARLQERNRIAREIHDNVGHMLSNSLLQVGALLAVHKDDPIHAGLSDVRMTLDTAMNSIRDSVHDLHDESIDLKLAVNDLVKPLQESYRVRFEYDMGDFVPRNIKYAIIGIVKESISNIIKHSKNNSVDIILSEHPSIYQVIINDYHQTDNGKKAVRSKTDVESESGNGIGLLNIRNRVESLNGTLNISNNDGFRIFVTFPKEIREEDA